MRKLQKRIVRQQASEHYITAMVKLMQALFANFEGHLHVQLWNGQSVHLGRDPAPVNGSPFVLIFRTPAILLDYLKRKDPLSFAEAYFRGEMDVEGDLSALLALREAFARLKVSWHLYTISFFHQLRMQLQSPFSLPHWTSSYFKEAVKVRSHSRSENLDAIQFHYDVSNAFYALWLDPDMVYSCAYFDGPTQSLEHAQQAKLDLICQKLHLKPGDRFLDIGCGWGALLIYAARHYGVRAYGVTLSKEQYDYAQLQIIRAGLMGRVSVVLQDYRDIPGSAVFNKIASVGMFEHVGIKNMPVYFQTVMRLLSRDGLFLNHGITSETEGWPQDLGHTFINRYVFPDGQLEIVSNIQRQMELAGFEILDVEAMRAHYVLTLQHWIQRLQAQHLSSLAHINEATYRVWLAYLTASQQSFASGKLGLYQILICPRSASLPQLPLTRQQRTLPTVKAKLSAHSPCMDSAV